ncbi:MAG: hypothetical protein ACK55I_29525, partial [bacterium]
PGGWRREPEEGGVEQPLLAVGVRAGRARHRQVREVHVESDGLHAEHRFLKIRAARVRRWRRHVDRQVYRRRQRVDGIHDTVSEGVGGAAHGPEADLGTIDGRAAVV